MTISIKLIAQQKITITVTLFFFLFLGCAKKELSITGKTMGTAYHIRVVSGLFENKKRLAEKIDKRLSKIETCMSAYLEKSELSKFNRFDKKGALFEISEDFAELMKTALFLYKITEGAWDPSVKPAVDLWGFGSKGKIRYDIPAAEDIKRISKYVGFYNIEIKDKRYLIKKNSKITLDLGSIAKGYAVDEICELLIQDGRDNFLVEIGGEVKARGLKADGKKWKVGINLPLTDASYEKIYIKTELFNKAMAVSGDYRIFFEKNGRRYSHIIDPRTCEPVRNNPVSVSVIADECIIADGIATGLMVMGVEKGLALINRLENVECQITTINKKNNRVKSHYSKGFKSLLTQ